MANNKVTDKKCVLIARVSTREQEETGYSLPAQEKYLKEYCLKSGLNPVKVFRISESGSSKAVRKEFNLALTHVRSNKIHIIVCEKVDRFTRNQKDAVTVDDWVKEDIQHEVHFVKNSFVLNKESRASDKFVWNIHVSQAQFNIENLSEEVKKGQKEKISAGWYPSQAPIGYRSGYQDKKKIIELDPKTAPLIKQVLTEYATGVHSVMSICRFATKIGLKNLLGNYIQKTTMYRVLRNPFYYGVFLWNGESYIGNHPSIIDKDTYDKVQKYIQRKTPLRHCKNNALYSGMVYCADCGRLITWEKHKGHLYGYCSGCSSKKGVKEMEVNKPFLRLFSTAKINDLEVASAVKEGVVSYVQNSSGLVGLSNAKIEEDVLKFTKRLSKLYDDRADGVITSELYSQKFTEYNDQLTILKLQLKENNQDTEFIDIKDFETFFDASQNLEIYYNNALDDEKRKLLKFAFERVAYARDSLDYQFSTAYSLLYKAVEVTNSSEIQNSEDLKKYISEPDDLVASKARNPRFEAIRNSWLGS